MPARPGRRRLAASVRVLTVAAVLPVGLATVVAPPAAAATTSKDYGLQNGGASRIALTPDGTAWTSGYYGNAISRVTDGGSVTDPFLPVPGGPNGIVAAADGTVYSAQYAAGTPTIARIPPDGQPDPAWVTLPGDPRPYALAIGPAGDLFTANLKTFSVSKVSPDRSVTLTWGTVPARPIGIAASPAGGVLTMNIDGSLTRLDPSGTPTAVRGATGAWPTGLAYAPDGTAYVVDPDRTVTRISPTGVVTAGWRTVPGVPGGIATDGLGNVYVDYPDAIAKISPAGTMTEVWATLPAGFDPGWLAANADGSRVWAASLATGGVARVVEFFAPSAVQDLAVSGQNGALAVSFKAPPSDGGSAVTGYQVSTDGGSSWVPVTPTDDGGRLVAVLTTTSDAKALVNGTEYDVVVRAVNAAGPGAVSATVTGTPVTTPAPVSSLVVTGQHRGLAVSFEAPPSDGGSAVTGYQVSTDGGSSWVPVTPTDDGGRLAAVLATTSDAKALVNGTKYDVVVRAVNAAGPGAVSATVTAAPTAPPVTAPGPPTEVTVIGGDRRATVSWQPPADDGGAPITGYTAVATPEEATASRMGAARVATVGVAAAAAAPSCSTAVTSCTVTGLTNGVRYRFAVTATNSAGTSAPTAFADAVVPTAPPAPPAAPPTPTEVPTTDAPPPTGAPATTDAPARTDAPPTTDAPAATDAPATTGAPVPGASAPTAGWAPGTAEPARAAASPAGGLAYTGFAAVPMLLLGFLLLGGGGLALIVGRRASAGAAGD